MIALNAVRPGDAVRVVRLDARPEVNCRLRELGLSEDSVVRCLQSGSSCVCLVRQARVGISAQLAGAVIVEPV
jgi:Fe2+ transport system protein FeoA